MPIVHCKDEPYDVYIGRGKGSKWGNPFVIGKDGSREEVIEKYRVWIQKQGHLMAEIHKLHDKILGCWCGKQRCHGEVLLELAKKKFEEVQYSLNDLFEE
jgi:hypothetical protein